MNLFFIRKPNKKFKKIIIGFYIILIIAWSASEYREPPVIIPPKITRKIMPKEKPYNFPADYADTHKHLANLFGNASSMFTGGNVPVLVMPLFTMSTGGESPELLELITESAFYYLYRDRKVRIVRRDYNSGKSSRIKAKHILIGRVSAIGNQIRVVVRIQDVNTGEILDAYDDFIDMEKVSKYL